MAGDSKINLDTLSVKELTALIEDAQSRVEQKREEEKSAFLAEMRKKAADRGLSFEELFGKAPGTPARKTTRKPVAIKYRGPAGEEWSGRGMLPNWLKKLEGQGGKREEYLVSK